jgi:RND family efflux transporter MFP subunit
MTEREQDRVMRSQLQAIVMAAIIVSACPARGQPPGRDALVGVKEIVQSKVAEGQSFVGTVYPLRKSTVGSTQEGRVVSFLVNEGEPVTEGQPLAELRIDGLQIELKQAEYEAELRKQELLELQTGSRPEEKAEATAALERDKALMDYAQAKLDRAKTLIDDQTISQEEFDETLSAATAARNNYLASKARSDLVNEGPRQEKMDQAQARFDAQKQLVALVKDKIAEHTIRAPFAGYVSAEHTQLGQWVGRGDPIADVVDLTTVEIKVSVPGRYIANVHGGMEAAVRVEALPGKMIVGKVFRVVPQADVRSRTFPVIIRLENPKEGDDFVLKAGMLARATLGVKKPVDALLVPKDALVLGGETPRIFIVRPSENKPNEGTAVPVPVEIGVAQDDQVQVIGAVAAGQLVVVRGNERLLPFGQPVKIVD